MITMMKATACIAFLLSALLAPTQDAVDADNSESVIRALEHAWVEGEARNDNGALDLIFDNALVYIEYGRVMTKGEYLSRIKTAGPNLDQITMETINVRTFGNSAVVVGVYHEKGLKGSKTFLTRWRFIDTWVNKKGRWMLVAAAAAPILK